MNLHTRRYAAPKSAPPCMAIRRQTGERCGAPSTVLIKRNYLLSLLYLCDDCAKEWH